MEAQKKCKRLGCLKSFNESENNAQACHFHPGKPIFHDLKKGYTCCEIIVYDWDEFQKIKPCAVGFHSDVESNLQNNQSQFFQSQTVSNAAKGLENFRDPPPNAPKNIADFNREMDQKRREKEIEEAKKPKSIFLTPKGLYKCVNKGCLKEYDPNDATQLTDDACRFHPGQPVFHDLKKFWTCCKIEKYDWDEFMAIKTCAVGKHDPKKI